MFVNQLVQQPWVLEESTSQQKPTFRPGRDIYANIYIYVFEYFFYWDTISVRYTRSRCKPGRVILKVTH